MAALNIQITNNSSYQASDIHIGFVPEPGTDVSITNRCDQTALHSLYHGLENRPDGNWYPLEDVQAGFDVGSFSGRIYVCYGAPWVVQGEGLEPGQAVTDPNFFLRYDKMEITYTGSSSDVADLTSIDYWSIPMSLTTFKVTLTGSSKSDKKATDGDKPPLKTVVQKARGLLPGMTTQAAYNRLKTLTAPPISGVQAPRSLGGELISALVPGCFKQYPGGPKPGKEFARIIGPSSYPAVYPTVGIPVMPYDLLRDYLQHLYDTFGPQTERSAVVSGLGKGLVAIIAGEFAGSGADAPTTGLRAKQHYQYGAFIDAGLNITLEKLHVLARSEGAGAEGAGIFRQANSILFRRDDMLNPSGIYGGNAPFYLDGDRERRIPENDIYGWISGDLFAGLNIGALGSQTKIGGAVVGAMESQDWFNLLPGEFFTGLQPNSTHFNRWAQTLSAISDAYSFAYSDRFAVVQVGLDPAEVDMMEITLESGKIVMG